MIAHIVLFTPKADVDATSLRSFAKELIETCQSVETVKRASVGRSINVDAGYGRNFGDTTYQYTAVLEFEDEAGLLAYLQHPLHHQLGRRFWELCASTVIVESDFRDANNTNVVEFLAKDL